jgi:hypothetical protein
MDAASFEALVGRLLAQDNDTRKAAEAEFERVKAAPEAAATLLLQCLRTSADTEKRSFAAIMLRKVRELTGPIAVTPPRAGRECPLACCPAIRARAQGSVGFSLGEERERREEQNRIAARSSPPPSFFHNHINRSSRATSPTSGPSAVRPCRSVEMAICCVVSTPVVVVIDAPPPPITAPVL